MDAKGELTIVKRHYVCSAEHISIEDDIVYMSTFSVDQWADCNVRTWPGQVQASKLGE